MICPLHLEEFDDLEEDRVATAPSQPDPDLSYEAGYQAGILARQDEISEARRVAEHELLVHLQSLEFSYHDVRAQLLSSLGPLIELMLKKILPRMMDAALSRHISEALFAYGEDLAEAVVELRVHPRDAASVSEHFAQVRSLNVRVIPSEDQLHGRVDLRFGSAEIRVDPQQVLRMVEDFLDHTFSTPTMELAYG